MRLMRKKLTGFTRSWFRTIVGAFPVTKTGIAFLALFCVAVWFRGVLNLDLVLLVAGIAGILVILVLLFCTASGTFFLFRAARRAKTPDTLDLATRLPQPTGYCVRYPRRLPFTVVRWNWINDGGGKTTAEISIKHEKGILTELAAPARRCIVEQVIRRFSVRDIFGLTEISWRRAEKTHLRVLPERGRLTQMPPPAGMADGEDIPDQFARPGGDRVEMRSYAPGDPLRMVLWKVYAHSGRMMVRIPERSIIEQRKGCGYLVNGANDDATAAVARIAIERGLLGEDWCFGAEGVESYATQTDAALETLARSGEADYENRSGALGAFLSRMRNEGRQFCILFLPPEAQAWTYAAEHMDGNLRIQTLTGIDEIFPEQSKSSGLVHRVSEWFLRSENGDGATLDTLRQVISAAPLLNCVSHAAERQTGRLFQNISGNL